MFNSQCNILNIICIFLVFTCLAFKIYFDTDGVFFMSDKAQYISFRLGTKVLKFNKKIFKYSLILIVAIFILFPYMNFTMPTHFLTNL